MVCTSLRQLRLLLQRTDAQLHVGQRSVQVLVLHHELLALLHVVALEKVLEVALQPAQDSVQSALDVLGLGELRALDALVDFEDIEDELAVGSVDGLGQRHSPELHEVDGSLEVVEQGGLGLVDVGGVLGHLGGERVAAVLAGDIGVELLLQVLGHVAYGLGVDGVVLGTG
jgi:hypothetical protein